MLSAPALGQSVEEFYRGKQVRFIISSATGGDYDQWSRLIARYLGHAAERTRDFVQAAWRLVRPSLLGRDAVPPRVWAT